MPTGYLSLARYWRLDARQALQLWTAVAGSQEPRPCAWRQQVVLFRGTGRGSSAHRTDTVSAPAAMSALMEDLIGEGQIPPRDGRRLEEQLLRRTTKDGRWVG
jgi:hypothetical protein